MNCSEIPPKNEIIPKARESIHHVVLKWFSDQKRGKVFDAPAGYGHLSMHLKNMGFNVTSGEVEPETFKAKDLKCVNTFFITNSSEIMTSMEDTGVTPSDWTRA